MVLGGRAFGKRLDVDEVSEVGSRCSRWHQCPDGNHWTFCSLPCLHTRAQQEGALKVPTKIWAILIMILDLSPQNNEKLIFAI